MMTFDELAEIATGVLDRWGVGREREVRAVLIGAGVRAAVRSYETEPTNDRQIRAMVLIMRRKIRHLKLHNELDDDAPPPRHGRTEPEPRPQRRTA